MDTIRACRDLAEFGVAAIHIPVKPYQTFESPGFMIPFSAIIKKAVNIPVVATGRVSRPEHAAEILKHGCADYVAMGRALLADPELLLKSKEGSLEEIKPCIGCNEGCINRYLAGQIITCVQNLNVGREKELADIRSARPSRKILVLGGGPAGMTAAKFLPRRGYNVKLLEKTERLGGQINLASRVPGKLDYNFIITCLEKDLVLAGVEVHLNYDIENLLSKEHSDDIVVATGSRAKTLPALEKLAVPVLTAREFLALDHILPGGNTLAVIGGGLLGRETAYALATQGKKVVVVEQGEDLARNAMPVYRTYLLNLLESSQVEILTETTVEKVEESTIFLKRLSSGKTFEISVDAGVAMAVGAEPNIPDVFQNEQCMNVHLIGDAQSPGRIIEAMEEAWSCMRGMPALCLGVPVL